MSALNRLRHIFEMKDCDKRRKTMIKTSFVRIAAILFVGAIALTLVLMGPGVLEAGPKIEYKFVRLVDDGAMPGITDALNMEADRGWELEEMAVVPGEPGTIYLVFKK
jgi:hypothetical protein